MIIVPTWCYVPSVMAIGVSSHFLNMRLWNNELLLIVCYNSSSNYVLNLLVGLISYPHFTLRGEILSDCTCTLYCAKHYTYIQVGQLSLPGLSCLKGFLSKDEVKNRREGLLGLEPKLRRC